MVLMICKPDIECIDLRVYSKVITSHVERETPSGASVDFYFFPLLFSPSPLFSLQEK